MSVYIKGMEMPTSCSVCQMLEGDRMDGLCHAASRWLDDDEYWTWYVYPEGDMDDSKPFNCPLVLVPDHGRLIDADALDNILADQSEDAYNRTHAPRSWEKALSAMRDYLDNAPTIIPADKEVEE